MFPYKEAKKKLIEILARELPIELRGKAEFIVDLHLREDTLAMPHMELEYQQEIQLKILSDSYTLDEIRNQLILEDPHEKSGIFRVLVRTHLNRTGINHVSMGYFEKTLSPRILNFTDTIDINDDMSSQSGQIKLISKWLDFAKQNCDPAIPNIFHDERAITTLETLLDQVMNNNLILTRRITARHLWKNLNIDLGWCRIVLGVITGLQYLQANNWNTFEQANRNALNYKEIHKLTKDYQNNICEYGYALGGSFLADLGSPFFVKDDTHVRSCMIALGHIGTIEERVESVIRCANELKISPRILDKVMYIACSGNLYLLGIRLPHPGRTKEEFISFLEGYRRLTTN